MSKVKTTPTKKKNEPSRRASLVRGARAAELPVVISMGCPSGIGPEVVWGAYADAPPSPAILVGDRGALRAGCVAQGGDPRFVDELPVYVPGESVRGLHIYEPGGSLPPKERRMGAPSAAGGQAQLRYIEAAYEISRTYHLPLVTGPVSKEVIARSGAARARSFRGHTEWLEALDGAPYSVMCFASEKLVTSLVTTHIPIARVSRALTVDGVYHSILELCDLVLRLGKKLPRVAVCSLNPHAGEGELLGNEERLAIVPAIARARAQVGRRVKILGPIGAETAYRKGAGGAFEGVVAMYHDQATIPMKLLDFGGAVNVTQGLSIVRTSVDHGTAYDIAGRGVASAEGMRKAWEVALALGKARRRIQAG